MNIYDEIKTIRGVGTKTAQLFEKLGLHTLEDLLYYTPSGYDSYPEPVSYEALYEGERFTVCGRVCGKISSVKHGRLSIQNFRISDGDLTLPVVFFNMPFIRNMLKPGDLKVFCGTIRKKGGGLSLEQPQIFTPDEYDSIKGRLMPRYSVCRGLSSKTVTKATAQIFEHCIMPRDIIPLNIREKYGLVSIADALLGLHFPTDEDTLIKAASRMAFEEILVFLLRLKIDRSNRSNAECILRLTDTADTVRLLEALPFELTGAQKKVWQEIKTAMTGNTLMNRLVQGDVGSGKTIIAVLALLLTVSNGYQGALMAPTEVLAVQHFENIKKMTQQYRLPFKPVLLTGLLSAAAKRKAYEGIENGGYNLIVGTHALIQDRVQYNRLALVITDEQHRFGVRQRETLAGKGGEVHTLVMSATPIPRTLAIILYGDMELSVIDELPGNRLPIKNCVVGESYRQTAYSFMKNQIACGRQVYIICPLVEESETMDLENVRDYTEKLKESMGDNIRTACLHGRMKSSEKNDIMNHFQKHDIDILVSTTVIEVGIDVPNATVIMIENSERFGLAQLHQLRGRVGRGKEQSYCIFMTSADNPQKLERLSILGKSNDGFEIAASDLKLRGPGDFFGIRQSGAMDFRFADIYRDSGLIKQAEEASACILESDPGLESGELQPLKKRIENIQSQLTL